MRTGSRARLSWLGAFAALLCLAVVLYIIDDSPALLDGVIGGAAVAALLVLLSWVGGRRDRSTLK